MVMRGKEEQSGVLLKKEDIDQNSELWSHTCLYSVSQAVSVIKIWFDWKEEPIAKD